MKIVDKSKEIVKFIDLEIGDIFRFRDLYYIKTEDNILSDTVVHYAVDIEGGWLTTFSDSKKVQKVNATLVIGGDEE